MEGLLRERESFATLIKISKQEKSLEEIKRYLINFNNENFQENESIF